MTLLHHCQRLILTCVAGGVSVSLLGVMVAQERRSVRLSGEPSNHGSGESLVAVNGDAIATGEVKAVDSPEVAAPGPEGQERRERIVATRDAAGALELGWAFFERKQWESARQWFQEAYRFDPDSKRAAEGLIMTEYRSGDVSEAYQLAVTHADLVPQGREIVAEAAAASGRQLIAAGELEQAEAAIDGIPKDESAVAVIHESIAENRMETAMARDAYDEARAIAKANALDVSAVDRGESAYLLQLATDARDEGNHRESLELIGQAESLASLDRSGRRVKAWALYQNREFDDSADLFESLYREGKDRDSAEGLVNSLQQAGELDQLNQLSDEMGGPLAAVSEPVLMAAARADEEEKRKTAEQQRQIAMAAAEEEASRSTLMAEAELPEEAAPVEPKKSVIDPPSELWAGPMGPILAAAESTRSADVPLIGGRGTIPERARLNLGGGVRVREGDRGGIDRLRVNSLPSVETTLVFGAGGNQAITLGVHVLNLESDDYRGRRLVGSADSSLDPGPFVTETDTLVEPRLGYRVEKGRRAFYAEIGATPLGADISASPIGAAGIEWQGEKGGGRLEGFADSVQDSLLSYTGMSDPYTGEDWGRVIGSGVRVDGAMKLGRQWSGHGLFEFSHLEGRGVADNNAVAADLGLSYALDVPGFEYVSIGPTFHFEHYEKNLSEFTRGHGGYFSPDELYQGMLGISFLTESGRAWLAEGFLGVGGQTHDVASAPVLPNSPDGRFYDASSDSSAIFTARLQALFELNPQWRLGAEAGYAKSAAYEDFAVSLYLSILFEREWGLDRSDFVR